MRVVEAEFLQSATDQLPPEGPPEIAFAGRSNVGKSTLLAALLGRRGLVRVSATPGRTRLLNFFRVVLDDKRELRFVDLPGYGYAKVSKDERKAWMARMERYLGARRPLRACVLLMDARRGPELDETELDAWMRARGVRVIPVLTKTDKLAKHERGPAAERARQAMGGIAPLLCSGTDGDGVSELLRRVLDAV
jgi:GTP-binding protein